MLQGQLVSVAMSCTLSTNIPTKQLSTAKNRRCDLIVMASHGRRGISAIVLGSETVKVLTHSTIPVLVFRGWHAILPPYFAAS
jgi:hypothetical protein